MATEILDGTGGGHRAKVDKDNRTHVQSLSIDYDDWSVLNGDSFAMSSGVVTLTGVGRSDLLYFKNTSSFNVVLSRFEIDIGTSVGGIDKDWFFWVTSNPLQGSLAGPLFVVNNNIGSPEILTLEGATGGDTDQTTGGIPFPLLIQGEGTTLRDQNVVVPPGTSISVGFTPPASNTSAKVAIGITIIKQTIDFK